MAAPSSSGASLPNEAAPPSAPTDLTSIITELEHSTWRALKKKVADLLPYLSADCTMQFPLGASLSSQSEPSISDVLTTEAYRPWKHYELKDVKVVPLGTEGAVISYRVVAWRGEDEMEALVGSTWRKEAGDWKLVFHQQTPY